MIDIRDKDIFYNWIVVSNNHAIDKLLSLLSEDIEINSIIFGHLKGKIKVKEFLCEVNHIFPIFFMNPVTVMSNLVDLF